MWPLVHVEEHGMEVDEHLDREVWRRPRLDSVPWQRVMVRVDQRLVQVQHERLFLHQGEATARYRRQGVRFVRHWLVLDKLSALDGDVQEVVQIAHACEIERRDGHVMGQWSRIVEFAGEWIRTTHLKVCLGDASVSRDT